MKELILINILSPILKTNTVLKKVKTIFTFFLKLFHFAAINLLDKIFQLEPSKRVTCEEALQHAFFHGLHDHETKSTGTEYKNNYKKCDLSEKEWKGNKF